ncbi:MAG: glycoside hydrolase family 3 C-terminal domain-containing protein [Gammaproteobacteria bacterium]|nr:glycoside hydrolase family 3 C-terminal domain-containing protein [Gammaproteobacteria bacterium]
MTRVSAEAIVARMALSEKAELCSGADVWRVPAIARLALPSITLTDGPHGVRKAAPGTHSGLTRNLPATCFPTASALASTWDVDLLREVGAALGTEAAAADVAVLLGPGMNIKRHPLCGRNFEYFSEDPLLSGRLAAAMVKGIQSRGVGACVKHFAANDQEHRRMVVDVIADERTLREIHLRGFEIAIRDAQPWTVMSAYNRLNGVYCSENGWLLNDVLRRDWGFEGTVMTDWGATNERTRGIEAGNDLEMPSSGGVNDRRLVTAVRRKELNENVLERSAARVVELVLKSRARSSSTSLFAEADHHALARRAAAEGAVLLKNDGNALPFRRDARIAVIGAFAKEPRYQGTGSSRVTPTRLDCAFDAMRGTAGSSAPDLLYAQGYDPELSEHDPRLIEEAAALATEADAAVVFAGLPSVYESEGFDRPHMRLPDQHDCLITAVCEANPNTVVVLANGAPVEMPWVESPKAILEAYLGGQAGGSAVADLLFGRQTPCGKLAETFPQRQADVPSDQWFPGENRQVQYREGLYVGYRHFDSFSRPVLFPFGHGLSYTRFEYGDLQVVRDEGKPCRVALTVTNSGTVDGAEIVQVYVHRIDNSGPYRPEQELRGFSKVMLEAGASESVTVDLDPRAFTFYDVKASDWADAPGEYEMRIGASSRDIRLRQRFVVDGEQSRAEASPPNGKDRPVFQDTQLRVDDETFAAMLGTPVPPPEGIRPFHLNSTLSELETTWLGGLVARRFKARFVQRLGGRDKATQKMVERMAADTPLRSLVLFSRGKISFTMAETLVAVLNGRFLSALGRLAGRR